MDFGNPLSLFSGLVIGLIGFAVFLYGKKQSDVRCLSIGVIISVFPYFVSSILLTWAITLVCLGALYAGSRGASAV